MDVLVLCSEGVSAGKLWVHSKQEPIVSIQPPIAALRAKFCETPSVEIRQRSAVMRILQKLHLFTNPLF